MNFIGIDWGKSKIGIAIGDDELKIASPFCIVSNFDELLKIIEEEQIDKAILGRPIKMGGENATFTEEYDAFCNRLKKHVSLELIDERLTTKHASGLIRPLKLKLKEDSVAAMLILQAYLDKI
ncbi:Holliday junction resolvase RuvX [Patescibacteria group bacterium]|nr:Holliday junction resolvase RuvX [Patescibacteria group bacterium]